jgi:hypothetical protein
MVSYQAYNCLSIGGTLSFVTSQTYFTDQNKEGFRNFLIGRDPQRPVTNLQLVDLSPKTFKKAVNPAIFKVTKCKTVSDDQSAYRIIFDKNRMSPSNSFISDFVETPDLLLKRSGEGMRHITADVPYSVIRQIPHSNLYIPTSVKNDFLQYFLSGWNAIHGRLWNLLETSTKMSKNLGNIQTHLNELSPYDLTIVGALCNGGKGMDTGSGCNSVHIALLDGSDEAARVREKMQQEKIAVERNLKSAKRIKEDEKKMAEVIKSLRKYGLENAVAEKPYIYKTVTSDEILDTKALSAEELEQIRTKGISRKLAEKYRRPGSKKLPCYVPLYKGQNGDYNRWHIQGVHFINWSEENVTWLMKNNAKKFKGAPTIRNARYFFRPAFGWNAIRTYHVKASLVRAPGVQESKFMVLSSITPLVTDQYITAYLNQDWTADILQLVTMTSDTQINDIKQMPIIIPDGEALASITASVNEILDIFERDHQLSDISLVRIGEIERRITDEFNRLYARAVASKSTSFQSQQSDTEAQAN